VRISYIAILLLVAMSGCDAAKQSVVKADTPVKAQEAYVQRFVPLGGSVNTLGVPWSGAVALDTKTGQLCSTLPKSTWGNIPRCLDLYENDLIVANRKLDPKCAHVTTAEQLEWCMGMESKPPQ
jgi:hypothetical protein